MSGMKHYNLQRDMIRKRRGLRDDLRKNPGISHYKEQLARGMQILEEAEKAGDAARIRWAEQNIDNLKGTIKRLEEQSKERSK